MTTGRAVGATCSGDAPPGVGRPVSSGRSDVDGALVGFGSELTTSHPVAHAYKNTALSSYQQDQRWNWHACRSPRDGCHLPKVAINVPEPTMYASAGKLLDAV